MIELATSRMGRIYQKTETKGPYVRVNTTQENHVDPGLQLWWKNELPEVVNDPTKADHGTILHGYIAGVLNGETISIQEEWAKRPMELFCEWATAQKIKAEWTEKPLVSDRLGIGGTLDAYIPELGIVDWKTGENYASYRVQLALYAALFNENFPSQAIPKLWLGFLHREGKKKVRLVEVKNWVPALWAGLLTFERWKYDNFQALKWLHAPEEVIEAYKKTRGKKREEFEEGQWKREYAWRWLESNALRDFSNQQSILQKMGGV